MSPLSSLSCLSISASLTFSSLSVPEFAYVLGLDSTASSVTTSVNTQPETCAPTGTTRTVQGLILAAVKNLKTDLTIQSVVKLDDYQTPLDFIQRNVPTVLDDSVLYLTGIIGKTSESINLSHIVDSRWQIRADRPISSRAVVSHIVDQAELSFSAGNVHDLTNSGFIVDLTGSLLNAYVCSFPYVLSSSSILTLHLPSSQWTYVDDARLSSCD